MAVVSTRATILSIFWLLGIFPGVAQQRSTIDSLESALNNNPSDSVKARLLTSLAIQYKYVDHAIARQHAEQVLVIAEKNEWPWAQHEAYRQLALLASLSGDFTAALTYDDSNLALSINQRDSSAIAEALSLIGRDQTELGQYDQAYYYFTQAYQVASAINDSLKMAIALHNLGVVFKELGQYDVALQHFDGARLIGEKINDADGLAYMLDEKADLFLRTKEYEKATEALDEALRVIRQRKLANIEPETLTNMARLHFELGEFEKSLAFYDSAYSLYKRTDNEFGLAETDLGKSRVFLAQGKSKEAEDLVNETLSMARELNANRLESESLQLLASLAERKGDYRNALNYFKSYKAVEDSIFSQEMLQKLFQSQLRFAVENKDSEIAVLSKAKAEQDEELKRQEFIRNILAVMVALTAILLFTIYRSGQRRIRINKLLLEHQAEIKKRSVELEQLNQVKDKFFSIISHDLRSPMNALAAILDLAEKKHLEPHEFAQLTKELRVQFNHTKTLINNLLDWTLLQMDKLSIQEDKIDLYVMVEENFKMLSALQLKQTKMENHIPAGTFAKADTNMISLVFRNLIMNGIKFTESGGVIKVGTENRDGFVVVSIADNGVGIHPDVQKILFEKTSGYSTRGTANEKGTGLGLILCKEFVERNGGKIWLKSEAGQGSTFYFTLKKA